MLVKEHINIEALRIVTVLAKRKYTDYERNLKCAVDEEELEYMETAIWMMEQLIEKWDNESTN